MFEGIAKSLGRDLGGFSKDLSSKLKGAQSQLGQMLRQRPPGISDADWEKMQVANARGATVQSWDTRSIMSPRITEVQGSQQGGPREIASSVEAQIGKPRHGRGGSEWTVLDEGQLGQYLRNTHSGKTYFASTEGPNAGTPVPWTMDSPGERAQMLHGTVVTDARPGPAGRAKITPTSPTEVVMEQGGTDTPGKLLGDAHGNRWWVPDYGPNRGQRMALGKNADVYAAQEFARGPKDTKPDPKRWQSEDFLGTVAQGLASKAIYANDVGGNPLAQAPIAANQLHGDFVSQLADPARGQILGFDPKRLTPDETELMARLMTAQRKHSESEAKRLAKEDAMRKASQAQQLAGNAPPLGIAGAYQ